MIYTTNPVVNRYVNEISLYDIETIDKIIDELTKVWCKKNNDEGEDCTFENTKEDFLEDERIKQQESAKTYNVTINFVQD